MQRAAIDLWSTSEFDLDRLQTGPQQYLILKSQHPDILPSLFFFSLQNAGRVTLGRSWQSRPSQIIPIFFDRGVFCEWDIKRQCHHSWGGVEGLSSVRGDNTSQITAGSLCLCLGPRGVSPHWLCSSAQTSGAQEEMASGEGSNISLISGSCGEAVQQDF